MEKIYTLLFAIAFCFNSKSQNYIWADGMGGATADERTQQCATDAASNVYITGYFSGTADFDPSAGVANLTTSGGDDVFIAKYNSSGVYQWAFKIGTAGVDWGFDIVADAAGNTYVTGYFTGTADFDPSASTMNITSTGGTNCYVAKYNTSGALVWAFKLGGTSASGGYALKIDASNVYVVGSFVGTTDFDPSASTANLTSVGAQSDIFIAKYSIGGAYQWAIPLGGVSGGKSGRAISVDGSGNVYATGYFMNTVDFDPSASIANLTALGSNDDVFVAKYNSLGAYQWAFRVGDIGGDDGYGITNDPTGNVYVCGYFQNTPDFNPSASTATLSSAGSNDIFVAKYNSAGQYQMAFNVSGTNAEQAWDISLDANNNIYITGDYKGTIDLDPSAATANITSNGGPDIYVAKYNPNGIYQWGFGVGGTSSDLGLAMALDQNGNLFLSGGFLNTVDFDPSASVANLTSTSASNWDIFLAKYCVIANQPISIFGPVTLCSGIATYSVAPIVGATSYSWSLPGGWSGSSSTNTISATSGTSGIFSVTASNACGTSSAQTLSVTVNPIPTITVNSGLICAGQSFTMVASGANTYTFSNGPIVSPTTTSSYSVTGTSTAGCVSSSAAISNVTVNPLPTISATTNNTLLCVGQSATLTASGASAYTWNPGGAGINITVSPTVTATYTITGTSAQGCNNSSVFTQSVSTCAGINQITNSVSELNIFPNPFSNKITVVSNGEKQAVQIFNSLGSLIYETEIESEKIEINLEKEPSGIYFIKIGTIIKKIIKE